MIAHIRGRLAEKKLPYLVVEANGLGYKLEVSLFTFESMPEPGEQVQLRTSLVVRDDAHLLYGFASEHEQQMFTAITRVSGFGPRLTMSMLSACRPDELAAALHNADKARLQKIPGIGTKSAERLIIELRDKPDISQAVQPGKQATNNASDAQAALLHLGFRPADIQRALRQLDPAQDTASLVRLALRQLA